MRILLATLFVAVFTMSSVVAQDYFPIKKGASWQYEYYGDFNQSGEAHFKVEVMDDMREVNGQSYFQIRSESFTKKGAESGFSVTSYVRKAADGTILGFNEKLSDEEFIFLPNSLEVGQNWDSEGSKVEIVDLNASIKTPEKTYTDCMVLKMDTGDSSMLSYYKKGVGLVAMEAQGKLMAYLSNYEW